MATTKTTYGASTAVTITLTSLANGASRESTAIDNTSNRYLDAQLYIAAKLTAGSPAAGAGIEVYLYASVDGTNYDENVTGADADITPRTPTVLVQLGRIPTETSGALTYKMTFKSVAAAFGGVMPRKWGVVVTNSSGFALDSSGNAVSYTGIHAAHV